MNKKTLPIIITKTIITTTAQWSVGKFLKSTFKITKSNMLSKQIEISTPGNSTNNNSNQPGVDCIHKILAS